MPAPETFRIYGTIARHQVVILVDDNSTHNFIQARLAAFLHLDQVPTTTMHVMIGNGGTIECNTKCPSIPILIQGYSFSIDLYQLPIGGANIILEVQWLKLLGPVTTDYALQLFGPVHIPACRRSFLPESGFGPTTEVIHPNPWYLCFIPINPYPQPDPFFPSRYNPTNYLFTPSLGSSSSSL